MQAKQIAISTELTQMEASAHFNSSANQTLLEHKGAEVASLSLSVKQKQSLRIKVVDKIARIKSTECAAKRQMEENIELIKCTKQNRDHLLQSQLPQITALKEKAQVSRDLHTLLGTI